MDPVKLRILDYEKRIAEKGYKEVTSTFIHETSSTKFHPQGLYSEEIFGEIATPERLVKNGYINLHTTVFHPRVFNILTSMRGIYADIMAGTQYAGFNKQNLDFEKCASDDVDLNGREDSVYTEVGTGFAFFMRWFPKLNIKSTPSISRNDDLIFLAKYKNNLTISKLLVQAAGLRDYEVDERGVGKSADINKLYSSLINLSRAIPDNNFAEASAFDSVRYAIQRKVIEIEESTITMLDGKKGFGQGKFGYRKLAYATRNVITSPNMAAPTADSPQFHDIFESKVPCFQAAKAFQPLVIHWLKMIFFSPVFDTNSEQISVIDPETKNLIYKEIDTEQRTKFTVSTEIKDIINLFKNQKIRFLPVNVKCTDGKYYSLYLIYDNGKSIYIIRSLAEFKQEAAKQGITVDDKYIRDLTYAEMMYISTYYATKGKNVTITRYPAIVPESTFPAKVHLVSTKPGRTVNVSGYNLLTSTSMPEYPIIGNNFVDSTILHPSRLAGADADFDGDCVASGSSIEIRFNDKFKDMFPELIDYISDSIDNWNYAEMYIEDFVKPGKPTVDGRGVKFYSIPKGCQIKSFDPAKKAFVYAPISKFTDEGVKPVVTCTLGNKGSVTVTTNKSIAAFDAANGTFVKMSPKEAFKNKAVIVVINENQKPVYTHITKIDEAEFSQCWDFDIPSTKVYAVNDGIIVYDTISVDSIMSNEGNAECEEYYKSPGALIDIDGGLIVDIETDILKWVCYNLTRDPSVK